MTMISIQAGIKRIGLAALLVLIGMVAVSVGPAAAANLTLAEGKTMWAAIVVAPETMSWEGDARVIYR